MSIHDDPARDDTDNARCECGRFIPCRHCPTPIDPADIRPGDEAAAVSDIDLLAALAESIERAKQRRRDAIPCDKCGGDRLRPDFTVSESCHAPIGRAES